LEKVKELKDQFDEMKEETNQKILDLITDKGILATKILDLQRRNIVLVRIKNSYIDENFKLRNIILKISAKYWNANTASL
tara:strand:- start:143 stop:382 length:240 start_codon:yes stop_codon:yes gene_type:complete